jgi:serine-type D-Ala-D-Ala endopeptidase (penicillin-binding protein 7)
MTQRRTMAVLAVLLSGILLIVHGFVGQADAAKSKQIHKKRARAKIVRAKAPRPPGQLVLRSASALVADQRTGECLLQKQPQAVLPIASITKLMTAMVVLDAKQDLSEPITIVEDDKDRVRHSRSRLPIYTVIRRGDAMLLALMASENRAANALGRTYPGGMPALVAAMNAKAQSIGLAETHFDDASGISSSNVSSARDLVKMVDTAYQYDPIRQYTTRKEITLRMGHRVVQYRNSNRLIGNPRWQIGLSKTGFIDEAGRCLVMQSRVGQRPVVIVLLDSHGTATRYADANRIKQWMEGPQGTKRRHS